MPGQKTRECIRTKPDNYDEAWAQHRASGKPEFPETQNGIQPGTSVGIRPATSVGMIKPRPASNIGGPIRDANRGEYVPGHNLLTKISGL